MSQSSGGLSRDCGGRLEKQWSLSGFQFKGEGWYVTDYSNKLKEGAGKAEKTEKREKIEKTEKKSEVESTAKGETASNKSNDSPKCSKTESVPKKD